MANIPVRDSELPSFRDRYLQIFNSATKRLEIRRRSRAADNVSLTEAMELCAKLLRRYQMTYWTHQNDRNLVWFPFMYKTPKVGTGIRNETTGEVYTVDQLVVNREKGIWDGLVRLNLSEPPNYIKRHSLSFTDHTNYIKFDHEMPQGLPNQVGANKEGEMVNPPPIEPTVTWNIERSEPGGLGRAFDPRKELKPRLREQVKDPLEPGYTVLIYGQSFDNIVQFDMWTQSGRSSERLYMWFEQFLKIYTRVFREYGVQQMFFWRRLQDRTSSTWRQHFPVRTLQWYFRTESLEAVYERDILKLDINIDIETNTSSLPSLDEGYRWIADQPVSGVLTPQKYRNLFYSQSGEYLFGDVTINDQ